jgi:hypothetical protein
MLVYAIRYTRARIAYYSGLEENNTYCKHHSLECKHIRDPQMETVRCFLYNESA